MQEEVLSKQVVLWASAIAVEAMRVPLTSIIFLITVLVIIRALVLSRWPVSEHLRYVNYDF